MADQALWLAVITQALTDAVKPTALNNSGSSKENLKVVADNWFSEKNRDFIRVCAWADVQPAQIIGRYESVVSSGERLGTKKYKVQKVVNG